MVVLRNSLNSLSLIVKVSIDFPEKSDTLQYIRKCAFSVFSMGRLLSFLGEKEIIVFWSFPMLLQ